MAVFVRCAAAGFLSTLSLRRATMFLGQLSISSPFLSTLSLRRATLTPVFMPPKWQNFYPRSPCGERLAVVSPISRKMYFYPRSPCGERRCYSFRHTASSWHFYPRSPCGERQLRVLPFAAPTQISIHALLAESDLPKARRPGWLHKDFYPRSPCGERPFNAAQPAAQRNFYPRSPCGERPPPVRDIIQWEGIFLSTLSVRRAT